MKHSYIANHPKLCYTIGSHRAAGNPGLRGADHTKAMEFFPSGPLLFLSEQEPGVKRCSKAHLLKFSPPACCFRV